MVKCRSFIVSNLYFRFTHKAYIIYDEACQ